MKRLPSFPFETGWVAVGQAVCYKPNSNSYSNTSTKTSRRQSWFQVSASLFAVPCMWELSCNHCTPIESSKAFALISGSYGRTFAHMRTKKMKRLPSTFPRLRLDSVSARGRMEKWQISYQHMLCCPSSL